MTPAEKKLFKARTIRAQHAEAVATAQAARSQTRGAILSARPILQRQKARPAATLTTTGIGLIFAGAAVIVLMVIK